MSSVLEEQNVAEKLPYDPDSIPRELKRHYIGADEAEEAKMLESIGLKELKDLYAHIPEEVLFSKGLDLPEELGYDELRLRMLELSKKNNQVTSFIGDALPVWEEHPIVGHVCNIRNLTTSYTPYQPERSQGTLMTHWIYQCALSMLTGFEAVNSSLYERSTALYEAICVAIRLKKKQDTVILAGSFFPGDIEVIETMIAETDVKVEYVPASSETGLVCLDALKAKMSQVGDGLAAVAFHHVNALGLVESVDSLSDICAEAKVKSIAVIDPMLLVTGGLKPPTEFGQNGVDMIVGEGQHLAIGANFGGPGLGIFGIRHNSKAKNEIRSTPGRFVGKATDASGRECRVMVLSTREQHIRKEKATSNICSNQAFLATIAGAAILGKGEDGLKASLEKARAYAVHFAEKVGALEGLSIAYEDAAFVNEVLIAVDSSATELISSLRQKNIQLGVDVSDRILDSRDYIKVSFSDLHSDAEVASLIEGLASATNSGDAQAVTFSRLESSQLRSTPVGLPNHSLEELKEFYDKLGEQNISPDDTCYPLGSCTMKYNPYINDWAAGLKGFTSIHPQAPVEDSQGCLELLYETQEWFCEITGLAGVTTQPVAGAQGELVGLKMFQAYHRDKGDLERDVILIPKSAHGTNFATAAMAGFTNGKKDGRPTGIVLLDADSTGRVDQGDLDAKLAELGPHVSGIMVTNPNTGGIFESDFKLLADKVHAVGGLVYMDGANMNAIAGWVDLGAMGVDAVHNNLHKTWTIPHGGGGPGDAIVAVSETIKDYLPGKQIVKQGDLFIPETSPKSIGSFHRHWGNFAHKVRCFTYLLRLGKQGVPRMAAVAVLSARYLHKKLGEHYPSLPLGADGEPRMHEFIMTLEDSDFEKLESVGIAKAQVIPTIGKLFLDFGYHAPTVAFPEVFGLMVEPTETYSISELDRFVETVIAIQKIVREAPEVLKEVPYFTPVDKVDEVAANRSLVLHEDLTDLPEIHENRFAPSNLWEMEVSDIYKKLIAIK